MSIVVRFPPQLRRVDTEFLSRMIREEAPAATVDLGAQPLVNMDAYRGRHVQTISDDDPTPPPAPAMALMAA